MKYDEFIEGKTRRAATCGFEPKPLTAPAFDWQGHVIKWAVRQGRAALFEECGLGKSLQQLEWADQVTKETGLPVLVLTPLSVAPQTASEAVKFGLVATVVSTAEEITGQGVFITNYDKLDHFDSVEFGGVVLDECFAPGTMVKVFNNEVESERDIKDIRPNDKIINASGVDTVSECHRREIQRAFKITFRGRSIIASENHPWLTQRGWVPSRKLRETDWLLEDSEAVRILRGELFPQDGSDSAREVLREIMLSEMADAPTGTPCESSYAGSGRETRGIEIQMAQIGEPISTKGIGENKESQFHEIFGNKSQAEPHIERDEPQTFRSWWKREGFDSARIHSLGGVTEWVGDRICLVTGKKETRLSDLLQIGSSEPRTEDQHRGRRTHPSESESDRRETGCDAGFIGVESIEVLERGNPELERFADADGNIYFYDIGLTRHPSFSVNGALVHNSSILKNFTGKTRIRLTERFAHTPYRLCCTATPSPNDYTEFGQHAEFLGVCSSAQMLATFFINDTFNTGDWRLKKHAESEFWKWVASWAACVSKPSDIGFSDEGYILPGLNLESVVVHVDAVEGAGEGELFRAPTLSATTMHAEMRMTSPARVEAVAKLVNGSSEQWLIWCNTNDEADQLKKAIPDAVDVRGSDTPSHKEKAAVDFVAGKIRAIISKPGIYGYGLNLQNCHNLAFVGLSYSFEDFYQALRRSYRFGQTREVNAYVVQASTEDAITRSIRRKIDQHERMQSEMKVASLAFQENTTKQLTMKTDINTKSGDGWKLHHGDCVRVAQSIESQSIDFSIFSPPFADLFTYSNDLQDMGNCNDMDEFRQHFEILIEELARIMVPGREVAVHCVDLLSTKWKHGYIGFQDFSGEIIRSFWKHGFTLHSRITIWKSPVTEMQRTKAHGLLYKTLCADSSNSRVGCPDYLLVFRAPGVNPKPVTKDKSRYSVDWWQEVASPVWMTVDQGNVLNKDGARDHADERHICPLQLDVIERAVELWSNEGDLVFSPFTGIGSEGWQSLKMNRRFEGAELKESYFNQACQNLANAKAQLTLL